MNTYPVDSTTHPCCPGIGRHTTTCTAGVDLGDAAPAFRARLAELLTRLDLAALTDREVIDLIWAVMAIEHRASVAAQ